MTIDLEQARELLKKAVETQGRDFVYNPGDDLNCYYEPRPDLGGPKAVTGCLVGVALSLAGENRQRNSTETISWLAKLYPDMLSGEATAYLMTAQVKQDRGVSWGDAYDEAEQLAESFTSSR